MESTNFLKFSINLIIKDWADHGRFLVAIAIAMAAGIIVVMKLGPGADLAQGILVGVGVVGPYGFAQLCFFIQRENGLFRRLLKPPITPTKLVLAKYASAFSMSLFVINAPGLFLGDFRFVGYLNIGVLLLTTICMAVVVISEQPWAPLAPIWIILLPYLYARPYLQNLFQWVIANRTAVSVAALSIIPFIIYGSTLVFENDMRQP